MLDAVVTDLPYKSGDEVAVMVNGLGGTSISELYRSTAACTSGETTGRAGALLRRRVLPDIAGCSLTLA